ncbi:P-loop containing nucleoside triphosphate hydrolase protein [Abortiporus biennis]|nr:P-loop containing nucleoside triphosphate hydrolase protein [Abortiporus biennis]
MPPPPINTNRPRSVLAKSNSSQTSQRSTLATPVDDEFVKGPSTTLAKPSKSQNDSETNIKVVIRCRRRSEREIQENSPIIITTQGAKGQDITIETAAPSSNLGIVTLPPTRTYPFDHVFGPEADQSMIYHDVVNPMLEEVLMGYNCTLFAYGQTGTGKTYTMQGDLTPTAMGNPSPNAGMIPRVLFRLFHQLETSGIDYSVKISFIELYNEELRDLLAQELSAPTGSTQPMGAGVSKDIQGGLKIFDDASKKGVFIQGLEEISVKDTNDALALLTKGSHRRQIAATKFNDHSSRSHSVFSITVHTKETSSIGDDLLKVGKLNLVDLAGSENIGRSGAENKRAREAGMINQSLLTLGRVINALVDRSSHVPYSRESKLTRLLQDSLGGRTKTCIIATVSPARSNMEETLSTLDYAIRAKSIRNKPEVNQRMSRNALLKEYVAEIERLKADVLAAREKNGIFFSEETWNQMTAEQELKDTEMQEAKKQVEIIESQLRNVREEFEQSIGLLMKREGELKQTKDKLQATESELVVKDSQLKVVKGALEEEVIVRQAYQDNETVLDGVAKGLKSVAHQTVNDLGQLFGKLERKNTVFNSNTKVVSQHSRALAVETRNFSTKLEDFIKNSIGHVSQLKAETDQFRTKELEALAGVTNRLNEQAEKIREALKLIHAKDQATDEAAASIQSALEDSQETFKNSFSTWSTELIQHSETTYKTAEASSITNCAIVEKAFRSLGTITEAILQEAQDYIASEHKALLIAKTQADTTSSAEIARLQQQNALLTRLLESEKVKSERAKDELIQRISGLLGDFTIERDRSLREAFTEMADSNSAAEEEMAKLGKQQGSLLDGVLASGKAASVALDRRRIDCKRTREGGLKAFEEASAVLRSGLNDMQQNVTTSTTTYSEEITKRGLKFRASFNEANDRMSRAKRARMEVTESMATEAQSGIRYMQRAIASTSRNAELFTGRVLSESSSLAGGIEQHRATGTAYVSSAQHATQQLADHATKEDMPTGMTPRKRSWDISDRWQLTERDAVLKNWRSMSSSSSRSDTFLPTHLPLPEGEESGTESNNDIISDNEGDFDSQMEDQQDETIRLNSPPLPRSLTSSTSSSASSSTSLSLASTISNTATTTSTSDAALLKRPSRIAKSSLPVKGTLTERSTNVLATRGSRRLRQR